MEGTFWNVVVIIILVGAFAEVLGSITSIPFGRIGRGSYIRVANPYRRTGRTTPRMPGAASEKNERPAPRGGARPRPGRKRAVLNADELYALGAALGEDDDVPPHVIKSILDLENYARKRQQQEGDDGFR